MKPEVFINLAVSLPEILNFTSNEFSSISKTHEDIYLYGKNKFINFHDEVPRINNVGYTEKAKNECSRALSEETCFNYIQHVSRTSTGELLICGSNAADPKCDLGDTTFSGDHFVGHAPTSPIFISEISPGRYLAITERIYDSDMGIYSLRINGDKPSFVIDKSSDDIFSRDVEISQVVSGDGAAYIIGSEGDKSFATQVCLDDADMNKGATIWSSIARTNLLCCVEEDCFDRPLKTQRIKDPTTGEETLLILFQDYAGGSSAMCAFTVDRLSSFFAASSFNYFGVSSSLANCKIPHSSHSTLITAEKPLRETPFLLTEAENFDATILEGSIVLALMGMDLQSGFSTVTKVTIPSLFGAIEPVINPNYRLKLGVKALQLVIYNDDLIILTDTGLFRQPFDSCEEYTSCAVCISIGDASCGWSQESGKCTREGTMRNLTYPQELLPRCPKDPVLRKLSYTPDKDSIKVNTSRAGPFESYRLFTPDGTEMDKRVFSITSIPDIHMLILNILDTPDHGSYVIRYFIRGIVTYESYFEIMEVNQSTTISLLDTGGSPLPIILGVMIPFLMVIPICFVCFKKRIQAETKNRRQLQMSGFDRGRPAGQSQSGSECEIQVEKGSSALHEKLIPQSDKYRSRDLVSEPRSDKDNSEVFVSCSSQAESVNSFGDENGAMVLFPNGTIKKLDQLGIQKIGSDMADITYDFAENERFIQGTLRKSKNYMH